MDAITDAIETADKIAGPLGVIALIFIASVFFFIKVISKYASETRTARNEVIVIQNSMNSQLKNLLEECERACKDKDSSIILKDQLIEALRKKLLTLELNEQNMKYELDQLRIRVRELEKRI